MALFQSFFRQRQICYCSFVSELYNRQREVKKLREGIHPKYEKAIVKCACGETFETRSTKSEIKVEICSKCHPFFTGKQKLVDTGGRVDRFKKRFNLDK